MSPSPQKPAFRVASAARQPAVRSAPPAPGRLVRVRAPATTSNLGPGFDAFGLALSLDNEATFERAPRWSVEVTGEGAGALPADQTNLIARACALGLERWGSRAKARIRCVNRVPLGRGLGSSAAAIVTGLVGAALLAGRRPDRAELLAAALEIEPHPDNLAACLWGGFTIAAPPHVVTVPWPGALRVVAGVPDFAVQTAGARKLLPPHYSRADAVFNVARASVLAAAIAAGGEVPGWAFEDRFHQDHRAPLVRAWPAAREAAAKAGAAGAAISGSGPTIVAFTTGDTAALGRALAAEFERVGAKARILDLSAATGASWKIR